MPIPLGILAAAGFRPLLGGVAAYVLAGDTSGGRVNTIQKFEYSTETRTTLGATTSTTGRGTSGSANSGTAGYYKVNTTTLDTLVNKILFDVETNAALATGMSGISGEGVGFANSGVASYIGRGRTSGGGSSGAIEKFAHSNDSRSTLATGASAEMASNPGSFANSGTAGYVAGGYSYGAGSAVTAVNKFVFPSDTRSVLTALSSALNGLTSGENKTTAGYIFSGSNDGASPTRNASKWSFSTDTRSTITNSLTAVRLFGSHAGASNTDVSCFIFGQGASFNNKIEKVLFSTDTGSVNAATLAYSGTGAALSNNGSAY
jgi:hypothetical protein